jgi:hypothetical protein
MSDTNQEDFSLISPSQAARLLCVAEKTLANWCYRGAPEPGLPYVKLGGAVRYRRVDLRDFIQARVRQNTSRCQKTAGA